MNPNIIEYDIDIDVRKVKTYPSKDKVYIVTERDHGICHI